MSIQVADNFEYKGTKPLDGRVKYATLALMKAASEATLYDGILAYVDATDKYYKFLSSNTVDADTGKWREFETGGGGGGDHTILTQNVTLSGSTEVAVTFTSSKIKTTSIIIPFAGRTGGDSNNSQNQFNYTKIITTNGQCVVTFASTHVGNVSVTVGIEIIDGTSANLYPCEQKELGDEYYKDNEEHLVGYQSSDPVYRRYYYLEGTDQDATAAKALKAVQIDVPSNVNKVTLEVCQESYYARYNAENMFHYKCNNISIAYDTTNPTKATIYFQQEISGALKWYVVLWIDYTKS